MIYIVINSDHLHAYDLLDNAKTKVESIIKNEYPTLKFEIEEIRHRIDYVGNKDDETISIIFVRLHKKEDS